MADISPQTSQIKVGSRRPCHKILWETLTTTNRNGVGVRNPLEADKTVQVTGTFGASASIAMQGSNDSTNGVDGTWFGLEGPGDSAIALTAAGGDVIKENTAWIRPALTNGDGSTDIDVTMVTRP